MSWLNRKVPQIPVVPNDKDERQAAIQRSQQAYDAALARVPEVDRIANAVAGHDMRNHYRDRLMLAYGENR